jgi:hypothetical protein
MGDLRMKVEGIGGVELALMKVTLRYKRGYAQGVEKGLNKVLKDSQKMVPFDTGALKSTGRIEMTGTGFNTRGYVMYGGDVTGFGAKTNVHYAVIVHEATHINFKGGKEAKYLEKAIDRNKDYVRRLIRDNMRKGGLMW